MPIAVAAPPQPVPIFSGFDYVTVDETNHRVYAAHSRSEHLLIVDATSGKLLGQVDTGPMHGVKVDPSTGDVFTGNGTDDTVSKVDPVAMKVLASVDVESRDEQGMLRFAARHVTIDVQSADLVRVRSGLRAGERVASQGAIDLLAPPGGS
jgi:DNA-binding beta-propeller fold protein YncE